MDRFEAFQHIAQVARAAVDRGDRVMPVSNAQFARGGWHQLGKTGGTGRTNRHGIEAGLGPDQGAKQVLWKAIPALSFGDRSHIKSFPVGDTRLLSGMERRKVLPDGLSLALDFRLVDRVFKEGELLGTDRVKRSHD